MRHGVKGKKLNRTQAERGTLYRNLVSSLFKHERIQTTISKAKVIRPLAEKMITKAKKQTLEARRAVSAYLFEEEVANKLFTDLATRFKDRPGGYTRILKLGPRNSDRSSMVLMELVDYSNKKVKKQVKKVNLKKNNEQKVEENKETEK